MFRSGDRGWNPEVSVIGPGGCMRIQGFSLRSGDRIGALGFYPFFQNRIRPLRPCWNPEVWIRRSLGWNPEEVTNMLRGCWCGCYDPSARLMLLSTSGEAGFRLLHVLFTLVLWGPRCALGCTGVLGSFDSKLRLAHTHSCFMSHTRYDSLWACHCGHATFCKGWPGSEVSGDLIQLVCPFKYNDFPSAFIVGTILL
ncbi:hypothetical protein DY000_02039781 [Brassica cretica]|uniref:Uncharacterized protein n=1 Tax=Brassica cretica TaxID=69181 RepID=A0ABQ7BKR4_BRACR|nr:hypothetical protein DY000_02039781 [Brassica cretica]